MAAIPITRIDEVRLPSDSKSLAEATRAGLTVASGPGRGGVEMNKMRSNDRIQLILNPGDPDQTVLDVTDMQRPFQQSRLANSAQPRSSDQIVAAFKQMQSNPGRPANGVVKIGSAPVSLTPPTLPTVAKSEAPNMQNLQDTRPVSMGRPHAVPPTVSPFVTAADPFAATAAPTIAAPAKVVYWDLPGLATQPDCYHELIFDKQQLILIQDSRWQESTPLLIPEAGQTYAVNVGGTDSIVVCESIGPPFQHREFLYTVLFVHNVLPIQTYLNYKNLQQAPPSPFASPLPPPPAPTSAFAASNGSPVSRIPSMNDLVSAYESAATPPADNSNSASIRGEVYSTHVDSEAATPEDVDSLSAALDDALRSLQRG